MKRKNSKGIDTTRRIILNVVLLLTTISIFGFAFLVSQRFENATIEKKNYSELITQIRNGEISELIVSFDKKTITGKVYSDSNNKDRSKTKEVVYEDLPSLNSPNFTLQEAINQSLGDTQIKIGTGEGEIIYTELAEPFWSRVFGNSVFQILIYGAVLGLVGLLLVRYLTEANSKSMSFGSSRAKNYDEIKNKENITFADVAGQQEAKEELMEIVDFLKRPEEYIKMGAKIPKGVLLYGSPGNGKTLLAKAIAGEAQVPFWFVSGSEFVEMLVGVGASRVRDLFKKAKKTAPCLIFIDEIDAVGRQRGMGQGGGNDEREQTLNQILVEMDGFEATTSVIVVGATNRPDVLDPALLRPGRFDRQVTVTSPDRLEREQILKVHSSNKTLDEDVDLGIVARRTAGFSGADLMNVLNEAAILTVRQKEKSISNTTLREAVEKVMLGPQLKSKVVTEEQKLLTAYHEAGHALIATVLPNADKVQKITIIPRGRAGGYTFSDQGENDQMTRSKSQFYSDIVTLYGGYVAEELVFGEVSTGASNDLARATELARNMVTKYGMSSLGPISYSNDSGISPIRNEGIAKGIISEDLTKKIDKEISTIIDNCYTQCAQIITKHKKYLDVIANKLVENEILELEEFNELVKDILVPNLKNKPQNTD